MTKKAKRKPPTKRCACGLNVFRRHKKAKTCVVCGRKVFYYITRYWAHNSVVERGCIPCVSNYC